MNFSAQQERGLAQVSRWLTGPEQVFRLFGYAGTGKTTLARHLGADFYAAFTGKAAHVLREKGCAGASTIHSLIYLPKEKSQARLERLLAEQAATAADSRDWLSLQVAIDKERENLRRPSFALNLDSELWGARLLVIDECSMVDERVGKDLLSFGTKVLVLGDPAQLPPVRGGGFFTQCEPDFLLDEVHRQARENPILDLATRVREGQLWRSHSLVIDKATPELALAVDQIICGRNETRHRINRRTRKLLGRDSWLPVPGDKLVCLRNNHIIGLMNGALYDVVECEAGVAPDYVRLTLEGGLTVLAHSAPFANSEPEPGTERNFELFDYGYALTCHKSQGSQWDSVLVFDESECFRGSERRWLYTAVTRAAHNLKVVA